MRIGVFGAGAWGTALAIAFSKKHQITLWTQDSQHAEAMRSSQRNDRYLPQIELPQSIQVTNQLQQCVTHQDLHLIVTPLAGLRGTLEGILQSGTKNTPLLWACKGIESGTGKLPHEIVNELCPELPYGVLTGPSFAAEVARGQPTAVTLASPDETFAREWTLALHQPLLRIYANTDLIGAEIGGALKNVIAIATGVCDGMGYGLNARAALITRGLAEITRLAVIMGAKNETMMGLAGMGDLILTCTGELSRNRTVGLKLASGLTLTQILKELGHVAEGVPAAREAVRLAQRYEIDMPICSAVYALMNDDGANAGDIVHDLLHREPKYENK